jgi:serine phosphatase RsbU (regulator of sigma subunit)
MSPQDANPQPTRRHSVTGCCVSRTRLTLTRIPSALLILLAVLLAAYAFRMNEQPRTFQNPVAFAFSRGALYVVEKENNTVVELGHLVGGEPMVAEGIYEIEQDDAQFYYMVRRVYPGPAGLVVHSYIYRQATREFVGYRFSLYSTLGDPPTPLLTILLQNPQEYPEITYAFDPAGNHYFANNCKHYPNIWKVAAAGGIHIQDGRMPAEVQLLGQANSALDKWESIAIGPDGRIFLTSGATGRIVEYSPRGERLREIGEVGFNEGELLAPGEVFFAHLNRGEADSLTVASRGNRSWVQFDNQGKSFRSISPLRAGYPQYDVPVGRFFSNSADTAKVSFDLANKALILFDGDVYSVSTTYVASQWLRTTLLAFIVVLTLLVGLFFQRIAALTAGIRFPFFIKMLAVFVPLLILSSYTVGEALKTIMKSVVTAESIRRSANLATAVINNLDLTDLEHIQQPEDREGPLYARVYQTIARIVDGTSVEQTPKWILHKLHEGRYYFGINIWKGAIFQPFVVPSDRPMFRRVLTEKVCQSGRYTDDQGEWFSYLCPVVDGSGAPIFVLELYRPAEQLDRAERRASREVLKIIGATVLAAVMLVLVFSFIFTRPLRKLIKKTALISRGNFEQHIAIRSRDELGDLARAFDRMAIDLKQYTTDLARTIAEKESIKSELRLAHVMQQEILPKVFPPFPNADNVAIFAQMEPAKEVGGDFYDFFLIDDDHMGVVVGDVSGKGVPAGLFMMRVRAMLRSSAMGTLSAAEALARINLVIAQENPSSTFATVFYFICNLRTGCVTFCNAGHNAPVWVKAGLAHFLCSAHGAGSGFLVGVMDDACFTDGALQLGIGESLVVYTDGVTESCNAQMEMFGEERLRAIVETNAHQEPKGLCEAVFSEIQQHQADAEQFDDIALLVFKFGIKGAVSQ